MPRIKLTQKVVDRLEAPTPTGKDVVWWDEGMSGFGVRCSGKTKVKNYVVQRDIDGKARRDTVGGTGELKLEEARERAGRRLLMMREGTDPKAARREARRKAAKLQAALDAYIADRQELGRLRPRSRRLYKTMVERHLKEWLEKPLRDITPEMVRTRHRAIAEGVGSGRKADEGKNRPGGVSANVTMRVLRSIWNHAFSHDPEIAMRNPVRLGLPDGRDWYDEKRRTGEVRDGDLPEFYKAVCGLENEVASRCLQLALFTGMRRMEAMGLRWSEVDFAAKMIRIPAERMKGGESSNLPMSDYVHDLLVAQRTLVGGGDFVFPANSKSGHLADPKFHLALVAKASGVDATMHDLRRTFARVAGETVGYLPLQRMLNHAAREQTEKYVNSRFVADVQRVADEMKARCGVETAQGENVARLH